MGHPRDVRREDAEADRAQARARRLAPPAPIPTEPRARLIHYLSEEFQLTLRRRFETRELPHGHHSWHRETVALPSGRIVCPALVIGPVNTGPPDEGHCARTTCVLVDVVVPGEGVEERRAAWLELRELPALVEYVTVAVDRRCVVVLSRGDDGWTRAVYTSGTAALPRYGAPLRLGEIYR